MQPRHLLSTRFQPTLAFIFLVLLLGTLWLAGGASRADAIGQAVVRSVAWLLLIATILFGDPISFRKTKFLAGLLCASAVLLLLQLVPLPPGIWQALPGRQLFVEAAAASGQPQPWRPWSIVPSATLNAASSLIVPATTLVLMTGSKDNERRWVLDLLLWAITGTAFVGLLQFSGVGIDNPLINDTVDSVSGTFANRNHFALFLAIGCLLLPAWAFPEGHRAHWRGPVALSLLLLFALTILASGSRAGLVLGLLALGIGLTFARRGIRRELRGAPRWVFPALIIAIVGLVGAFVLISVAVDRAASLHRALDMDIGQDLRSRTLPTVLEMIRTYFPAGSGFGGFDPIFRIHEPFDLLTITYFNRAHNDFLEIVLDGGLPGLLLLIGGLAWWIYASFRAWRMGSDAQDALPRLGSAMLLLVLVASAFDYPARTPMIMAVVIVGAIWLSAGMDNGRQPALPMNDQHL